MSKYTPSRLAPFVASAVLLTGAATAHAELTGNVGVTNNYIWRGVTQTNDAPAVSGGIDYSHESGFYAGTWMSNVDFSDPAGSPASRSEYEHDWYLGLSGDVSDFSYDLGYALFTYPLSENADFGEVYASAGYSYLTLNAAYTVNSQVEDTDGAGEIFIEGDLYYSATLDVPIAGDFGVSATYGHYEFDDDLADPYNHYNVYLNKGDFSFGVEANDSDGEFPTGKDASDPRVVVSWSHSTDLL